MPKINIKSAAPLMPLKTKLALQAVAEPESRFVSVPVTYVHNTFLFNVHRSIELSTKIDVPIRTLHNAIKYILRVQTIEGQISNNPKENDAVTDEWTELMKEAGIKDSESVALYKDIFKRLRQEHINKSLAPLFANASFFESLQLTELNLSKPSFLEFRDLINKLNEFYSIMATTDSVNVAEAYISNSFATNPFYVIFDTLYKSLNKTPGATMPILLRELQDRIDSYFHTQELDFPHLESAKIVDGTDGNPLLKKISFLEDYSDVKFTDMYNLVNLIIRAHIGLDVPESLNTKSPKYGDTQTFFGREFTKRDLSYIGQMPNLMPDPNFDKVWNLYISFFLKNMIAMIAENRITSSYQSNLTTMLNQRIWFRDLESCLIEEKFMIIGALYQLHLDTFNNIIAIFKDATILWPDVSPKRVIRLLEVFDKSLETGTTSPLPYDHPRTNRQLTNLQFDAATPPVTLPRLILSDEQLKYKNALVDFSTERLFKLFKESHSNGNFLDNGAISDLKELRKYINFGEDFTPVYLLTTNIYPNPFSPTDINFRDFMLEDVSKGGYFEMIKTQGEIAVYRSIKEYQGANNVPDEFLSDSLSKRKKKEGDPAATANDVVFSLTGTLRRFLIVSANDLPIFAQKDLDEAERHAGLPFQLNEKQFSSYWPTFMEVQFEGGEHTTELQFGEIDTKSRYHATKLPQVTGVEPISVVKPASSNIVVGSGGAEAESLETSNEDLDTTKIEEVRIEETESADANSEKSKRSKKKTK